MADTPDNKTQDEWNEETVYGPRSWTSTPV